MQTDAGLPIKDGKVYDYIFKAFLTMDAYVLKYGGDPRVREIQKDLNFKYFTTSGVQPCYGFYQRNTNKALIYGIQTEEGIAPSLQTGSVGPETKDRLPLLTIGSQGNFEKLFQYALYFNGYDPGVFDGIYGNGVKNAVMEFHEFVALSPVDGIAGKQTWLSAITSTGDTIRRGTVCDCVTMITPERAQTLINEGYKTVGRYLTNASPTSELNKKIQPGELQTIFNAGLRVFPIYQTVGSPASYFNPNQGAEDAVAALKAANNYGFGSGTTIYFAVDYDAYDYQYRVVQISGAATYNVTFHVIKTPLSNIETETIGKQVSQTNYIGINGVFFDADNGYDNPPTGGTAIVYNQYDENKYITVDGQLLSANYDYNESSSDTALERKTMIIYKDGDYTKADYRYIKSKSDASTMFNNITNIVDCEM